MPAHASTPPGSPGPTRAEVVRRGIVDALRLPFFVLVASMMGFGSLARDSGLSLGVALASCVGVWGLPGQVAMAELYAAGAGAVSVVLAVSLANARFLPMTVSFMPWLRGAVRGRAARLAMAQMLSVNTWAAGLRVFPGLPPERRAAYYTAFSLAVIGGGVLGTVLGYVAVGAVPRPVTLGLIFLNPIYFALLFAANRERGLVAALLLGAVAGPLFHQVSPDWGLLATGLVAGSAGWWIGRGRAG